MSWSGFVPGLDIQVTVSSGLIFNDFSLALSGYPGKAWFGSKRHHTRSFPDIVWLFRSNSKRKSWDRVRMGFKRLLLLVFYGEECDYPGYNEESSKIRRGRHVLIP